MTPASEVFRVLEQAPQVLVDCRVTLRDYASRWLEIEGEKDLKTVQGYRDAFENHLLPALGHFKLRSLYRQVLKGLLIDKRRKGYAKNTVRVMRPCSPSCCPSRWTDKGILPANPALQLGRRRVAC